VRALQGRKALDAAAHLRFPAMKEISMPQSSLSAAPLSARIAQGRGLEPADLVLKGAQVLDLITGELVPSDVAICGDTIVGVYGSYQGRVEVDYSAFARRKLSRHAV
jgi:hypothetical protein